jgi:GTP-binding protein
MRSLLKIKFLKTIASVKNEVLLKDIPFWAILGRSNVGKSSLINALTNEKVAKVSSTPGKTITVNLYIMDDILYLVDLPGYGYAKRSGSIRESLSVLLTNFWKEFSGKVRAILIIDSRHVPNNLDKEALEWLRFSNIPFILVANKIDKLKATERDSLNKSLLEAYEVNFEDQYPVSASKKKGLELLAERLRLLQ